MSWPKHKLLTHLSPEERRKIKLDYCKRYYQQHKEIAKQQSKEKHQKLKDDPEYIIKARKRAAKSYEKHKNDPGFVNKRYTASKKWSASRKEYMNAYKKVYKYNRMNAGKLTVETIQRVYEDNIKFFGTLTCVYCMKPIMFGGDSIDHKTPLSKGGLNVYNNLVVACKTCNSRKYNKTWSEFFWRGYQKENKKGSK